MQRFAWTPGGPVGRLVWKAIIPEGIYEIDHRTLAARFVRSAPHHGAEAIPQHFTTLEEAQVFCEQHWQHTIKDRADTSARFRDMSSDTSA
jgi:hypothetical protein